MTKHMYLDLLEPVLLIAGGLVFLYSLFLYVRRTKDIKSVLRFWQASMTLNHREFVLNRIGITIMFMGVMLRFFNNLIV